MILSQRRYNLQNTLLNIICKNEIFMPLVEENMNVLEKSVPRNKLGIDRFVFLSITPM